MNVDEICNEYCCLETITHSDEMIEQTSLLSVDTQAENHRRRGCKGIQ